MESLLKMVVFRLDDQKFSLHLETVDRIIPAIEIHPLPLAPDFVMGTINFYGEFVPVVNLRKIFLLPERGMELSDQLIITKTIRSQVALWVDSVSEIVELNEEEIFQSGKVLLNIDFIGSIFKLHGGIVLIHDLNKFLTIDQAARLEIALQLQKKRVQEPENLQTINPNIDKPPVKLLRKPSKKTILNT